MRIYPRRAVRVVSGKPSYTDSISSLIPGGCWMITSIGRPKNILCLDPILHEMFRTGRSTLVRMFIVDNLNYKARLSLKFSVFYDYFIPANKVTATTTTMSNIC